MNEDWNESISNGQPFTLRWNESLDGIAAELGVFTVAYPQEGLVVYELVSNLTSESCVFDGPSSEKAHAVSFNKCRALRVDARESGR